MKNKSLYGLSLEEIKSLIESRCVRLHKSAHWNSEGHMDYLDNKILTIDDVKDIEKEYLAIINREPDQSTPYKPWSWIIRCEECEIIDIQPKFYEE